MDLIIIFKQRKERYAGQYAPEIHVACTQYELEDSGGKWLDEEEEIAKREDDIVAVKRVRLHMSDSFRVEIRKLLLEAPQIDCRASLVTEEKCK